MKLNKASQAALNRCRSIEAQLQQISAMVAHKKELALTNRITDWGIVGDLGRIDELLNEIQGRE